jgi:hypothetical protein
MAPPATDIAKAREAPARPVRVRREVVEEWLRRGEPLLGQVKRLYEAVRTSDLKGVKLDEDTALGSKHIAAMLVAHALKGAVEVYLQEGWREAERWLRLELDDVRRGLERLREKLEGSPSNIRQFIDEVIKQLELDEERAKTLANANRDELSQYGGVTVAEKGMAVIHTLMRGGAYAKAVAGAFYNGELVHLLRVAPYTAYSRYASYGQRYVEKVKPSVKLAPGLAVEDLQRRLEETVARVEQEVLEKTNKIIRIKLKEILNEEIEKIGRIYNLPALMGFIATDFSFDKDSRSLRVTTTQLGLVELFVKLAGFKHFYIGGFIHTDKGERPQMVVKVKLSSEIVSEYSRVLRWLREGGTEEVKELVRNGMKLLREKASGRGADELRKVEPSKVAADMYTSLKRYIEEGGALEDKIFGHRLVSRLFLPWIMAYLWAKEGNNRAVADFITATIVGDGTIGNDVRLAIGESSTEEGDALRMSHIHKAALVLGILQAINKTPVAIYAKVGKTGKWFELKWDLEGAREIFSNATLHLYSTKLGGSEDEIKKKHLSILEILKSGRKIG